MKNSNGCKDLLIVGQGIGGSMLGWHAEQFDLTFDIFDTGSAQSASAVSSGIINPVTGPKFVKSWKIDYFLPFAKSVYEKIGSENGRKIVHHMPLWRHIPDVTAENYWESRIIDPAYEGYLSNTSEKHTLQHLFPGANRFGIVNTSLRIDVASLLLILRERWKRQHLIKEEKIDFDKLFMKNHLWYYESNCYHNVILATGHLGYNDKWFKTDAYRPSKGEVFICRIKGMPADIMIKYGKFIVPLGEDLFWIGSNYDRNFRDVRPDPENARELLQFLQEVVRQPFEIIDHKAGIRMATRYRRPFIGEHPDHPHLFLFNGLGTKGISMAPFLSQQLIYDIANGLHEFSTESFARVFIRN